MAIADAVLVGAIYLVGLGLLGALYYVAYAPVSETRPVLGLVLLTIIRALVALVLLTPLIVMAPPLPSTFFPYIVGKAVYSRTLVEIAFGLWVVLSLRHSRYRMPRSWLLPLLGAYVVAALLASLFGVSPQRSIWSTYERMQGFVDLAHWMAFVVVMASVFRSWVDWRPLLNFNLGVSFLLGLLGIAQHQDIGFFSFLAQGARVDITLGNPTYVGAYMLVNMMVALGFLGRSLAGPRETEERVVTPPKESRAAERRRRRGRTRRRTADQRPLFVVPEAVWRGFWAVVVVVNLGILWQSGTRGALFGLVVASLALALGYLAWGRIRPLRLASLGALGLFVVGALAFVGIRETSFFHSVTRTNIMLNRISLIGPEHHNLTSRLNSWEVGLRGFAARPLLGWGPENFTIAYDQHVTADKFAISGESFDQAHNKIVEELTTKGLLGTVGYLAVWVTMFAVIVRRVQSQSSPDQLFTFFVGAALTGYFAQNMFLFDTPGMVPQFYMLVSFVVYLDASRDPDPAPRRSGPDDVREGAESGALKTDSSALVALVPAGIVILLAVLFINYAPLNGSRIILETLNPNISWLERLDVFERSIDAAPTMGNYPRIVMFNQLANNWGSMTLEETHAALATAEQEGKDGLKAEPREWRLHHSLATLYHRASPIDPVYLGKARELLEQAVVVAPERIEVNLLWVQQHILEGDVEGARTAIDSYLERNPLATPRFKPLKDRLDQLSAQE